MLPTPRAGCAGAPSIRLSQSRGSAGLWGAQSKTNDQKVEDPDFLNKSSSQGKEHSLSTSHSIFRCCFFKSPQQSFERALFNWYRA